MSFRFLIAYLLEPIGYLLFVSALTFYIIKIKSEVRYKILIAPLLLIFGILIFMILEDSDQNTYLYSLIYLVTGVGWGLYFCFLFPDKLRKGISIITIVIIVSYFFILNIVLNPPDIFDSLGFVIASSGVILMIFIFFYQLLAHLDAEPLSLNFDFWICCSQLTYHLGAFGIFLTYNHFTTRYISTIYNNQDNQDLLTSLWGVHNVLLFLAALLTWLGVLWIFFSKERK